MKMRVERMVVVCYRAINGGHADGPRQTVVDRCAVAQAPTAFAPTKTLARRGSPTRFAASVLRGHLVDFMDGRPLARVAGTISQPGNLLAAPARLGGGRHV